MGSWKKFIFGEKMPDKNDPRYKDRYEKEVSAGRRFAKWAKLDKAAEYAQLFAMKKPKQFLCLTFGIVLCCFSANVWNMVRICSVPQPVKQETAVEKMERQYGKLKELKNINEEANDTIGD